MADLLVAARCGSGAKRRLSPRALPTIVAMQRLRRAGQRRRHRRQEPGAVAGAPRPVGRAARRAAPAAAATTSAPTRSTPPRSTLLQRLKVWDALRRRRDDAGPRHGRARRRARRGQLEFSAWEQRVGELAVITDAAALERELDAALRFAPHVTRVDADVRRDAGRALRRPRRGRRCTALDAGFERSDYGQKAIAARLVATLPHRHVARQWFRSPDVLALLPFDRPEPERSYALVWSLPAERADALLAMRRRPRSSASSRAATGGEVGALRARLRARRLAARRRRRGDLVRAGLGAGRRRRPRRPSARRAGPQPRPRPTSPRSSAVIAEREPWRGLGDERLLRRYVRQRAAPTWAMTRITDGLLRLFAEPSAPIRELRNNGMSLVNRVAAAQALAHRPGARLLKDRHEPILACRRRPDPRPVARACRVRRRSGDPQEHRRARARSSRRSTRSPRPPIPGIYELRIGTDIFYTDEQGNYLIEGQLDRHQDARQPHRAAHRQADGDRLQDAAAEGRDGLEAGHRREEAGRLRRSELRLLQEVRDATCRRSRTSPSTPSCIRSSAAIRPRSRRQIWCAKDNTKAWRDWMLKGTPVDRQPAVRHLGAAAQLRVRPEAPHPRHARPGVRGRPQQAGALNTEQIEKQLVATRGKTPG